MSRGRNILRRLHHDETNARHLADITRHIRRHAILTAHAAPGDQQRLRHIPAIGRGSAGAIPGTRPDHNPRILRYGHSHRD